MPGSNPQTISSDFIKYQDIVPVRHPSEQTTLDAFGRLRVSSPFTLFDNKQLTNNGSEYWDQSLSGSGATSIYDINTASTLLQVTGDNQHAIRQTFMRFNYQPGKSQFIFMTLKLGAATDGVTKRVGYFNGPEYAGTGVQGTNGIFVELNGSTLRLAIRNNGTDSYVNQSEWNIDRLDGSGGEYNPSKRTLDITKVQIFFIDMEWLGVGRVRCGFCIDGIFYFVHAFQNANLNSAVYMATPNLPLRYELSSNGMATGATGQLTQICATVMSEGGSEELGTIRSANVGTTGVAISASNTRHVILGMELAGTHAYYEPRVVDLKNVNIIATTNDDFLWEIRLNPGHTATYNPITDSSVKIAVGEGQTCHNDGLLLESGYGYAGEGGLPFFINSPLHLGMGLTGKRDRMVLCVSSFSPNASIAASLTWRENL